MHIVKQWLLPQLAVLCIFIACNNRAGSPASTNEAAKNKDRQENLQSVQFASTDSIAPLVPPSPLPQPSSGTNTSTHTDWDKKIIKTATLSLEVKNYQAFNELLRNGVKAAGGYIAQEEQNQSEYKVEDVLTIKVPVDQFDNALARLTPAGEKLLEKKITSEDVTTDMIDTKSRLEAKKMVRLRYLDLLKQARNMKEILEVQNEINSIQEEEESAAGRIQYLSHASSWSTIHLTFYQVLNASAGAPVTEPSFGTKILGAFVTGLLWIAELLVTCITIWPLWLAAIVAWYLIKKYRASYTKKISG